MDIIMTAGTRDLALSGSLALSRARAWVRVKQIDVPVTDRLRASAAEP